VTKATLRSCKYSTEESWKRQSLNTSKKPEVALPIGTRCLRLGGEVKQKCGHVVSKEARHEFGESGQLAEKLRSWLFLMPIFTAHTGNFEARGEIARGWVAVAACGGVFCLRCYDTTPMFGWASRT
jgi:hypothetical protein